MDNQREHLLDWLRDAHAMEHQTETLLKGQAERMNDYPELKSLIQVHRDTTLSHQEVIRSCINRLGGETSSIKDITGKILATGQNLIGSAMSDEVIKGAMTLYVFSHIAISSYTVIIAAARLIHDTETVTACTFILEDEISISKRLIEHFPALTQSFLCRSESTEDSA